MKDFHFESFEISSPLLYAIESEIDIEVGEIKDLSSKTSLCNILSIKYSLLQGNSLTYENSN